MKEVSSRSVSIIKFILSLILNPLIGRSNVLAMFILRTPIGSIGFIKTFFEEVAKGGWGWDRVVVDAKKEVANLVKNEKMRKRQRQIFRNQN